MSGQTEQTEQTEQRQDLEQLAATRRSLHGVAELVLAGPQFEQSHSIELRVKPGGFATTKEPDLRVDGVDLVAGDRRVPLHGRTLGEIAREVGVTARELRDVYADGPGLREADRLDVDEGAAAEIAQAFAAGDEALQRLAPHRPRVLWPEHFDVGIDEDEVNYGLSPGDGWCPEPYAYVGPWHFADRSDRDDPFWNAPFGVARTVRELGDASAVLAFFETARRRALGH